MDIIELLAIVLIGLATGFVDSTIGNGGLISIPFLIFLGLPPQVAIATDRLGGTGQILSVLYKFRKEGQIVWRYVPVFAVIGALGGWLGSQLVLDIEPRVFEVIIGILLFVLLPIIFLKQDIGVKRIRTTKIKKLTGFTFYLLLMTFDGFLGTGVGPLMHYVILYFLGLTIIESFATGMIPWLMMSITSLAVFIQADLVDFKSGFFLLIGMIIGGYLGAHLVVQKGNEWVKRLFVVVVIIAGTKLLFF